VLVRGLVTVVGLDDLVKEGSEVVVRFVGASIGTNTGVGPLSTREDSLSESVSVFVFSVFALLPNILGKALVKQRASTSGEVRHTLDILRSLEVFAHHSTVNLTISNLQPHS